MLHSRITMSAKLLGIDPSLDGHSQVKRILRSLGSQDVKASGTEETLGISATSDPGHTYDKDHKPHGTLVICAKRTFHV